MTDLLIEAQAPRPVPTRWSAPFWEALQDGRFLLQRCESCIGYAGYPKLICPHCHSKLLGWEEASGAGSIYTFSTVVANPPSTFTGELPYTIAIVTLDEGPRFLTRLVDVAPEDVACDMRVRLSPRRVDDELVMPLFAPAV